MNEPRKPIPLYLLFVPTVLGMAILVAAGLWMVDRGASILPDRATEETVASLQKGIAEEVARSIAAPAPFPAPELPRPQALLPPARPLPSRGVEAVSEVVPEYPRLARQMRMQGPVDVVLHVDPQGVPVYGEIRNGNPLFKEEALKASLGWRFLPALHKGKPVASEFQIRFNFKLA